MTKLLILTLLAGTAMADSGAMNTSAFDHFYNLEYEESVSEFRMVAAAAPSDAAAWNHVAQVLFYDSLYRAGMMGSDLLKNNDAMKESKKLTIPKDRDGEIQGDLAKAVTLSQSALSKNANDAKALYDLGNSLALQANYAFLVKHAWMEGLKDANQSRKVHEQLMKAQPDNYDARLIPGTHEYMVGTLPLVVRMLARTAGVGGNRARGLEMVRQVSEHGRVARVDAQILLPVLYRRENRCEDGIPGMRHLTEAYPRNFLFRVELAKFYAEAGHKPDATAELAHIQELIDQRAPGYTGDRVTVIRKQEAEVFEMLGVNRPVQAERPAGALAFLK